MLSCMSLSMPLPLMMGPPYGCVCNPLSFLDLLTQNTESFVEDTATCLVCSYMSDELRSILTCHSQFTRKVSQY